ncbi:MAG TPA: alpha/beta hydrolase [Anaerolineaceae bacterium]|nr:alpha/beta hydrolase [Anaerolineaceae bacterium]
MEHTGKRSETRIDKTESLSIGGIPQWISMRSNNIHNPIMLFLHGGPGTAQISFSRKSQRGLEDNFLVINWDQRGAGRSYSRSLRKEDMKIDRFIKDTEELIEYVLKRFGQEKVYLVGQSWGTIIGTYLTAKRPDLIWAYIAIGQIVDMERGELISYQFTLDEARRLGYKKAIRELEKIGQPPYANLNDAGVQRIWLSKFHGAAYEGTLQGTILKNISIRDLRPFDLIRFISGAMFSLSTLEDEQNRVKIILEVPELKVPVYFCCGRRDYNVPFELVVEYAGKLQAPQKRIIWFEHSAHLPNFEEPERFCDFCKSLLTAEL